ncbi:hypothetical protein NDU88_006054 [Pleurodeles waltl]|uniref:Uncharacterized protein n=1 Tax=Pleurodeles waltl TaxID=8319 RepID=A0AAV7UL12_PLEWA|nr:hypothetical protein NDU88_006054 [Pleurodeles waltl]
MYLLHDDPDRLPLSPTAFLLHDLAFQNLGAWRQLEQSEPSLHYTIQQGPTLQVLLGPVSGSEDGYSVWGKGPCLHFRGVGETSCHRASIVSVTNGSPGPTESYPGVTYKRTADPEEVSDLDIWDVAAAIIEEEKPEWVCPDKSEEDPWSRTETEWRTAPGAEERTESREEDASENANDISRDPETAGSLEKGQKTPTETPRRNEQCRHVPGGAWLTQVRSCLRLKFLPE